MNHLPSYGKGYSVLCVNLMILKISIDPYLIRCACLSTFPHVSLIIYEAAIDANGWHGLFGKCLFA